MSPKRYEILVTVARRPSRHSYWLVFRAAGEFESIAEARAEIDRIKARYPWAADLTYWVRKVGNKYPAPLL